MKLSLTSLVGFLLVCSCSRVVIRNKGVQKKSGNKTSRVEYKATSKNKSFSLHLINSLKLNQKNYLIDFDGDLVDELITLKDSYSKPEVFNFNEENLHFKRMDIETAVSRASFLKLSSSRSTKSLELGFFTFFQNNFMPPTGGVFYEVSKHKNKLSFKEKMRVNDKAKLPLTAVVEFEPTGNDGRDPMTFYFHWLKNINNKLTPVIDQYDEGVGLKNLIVESKERANFSASLCDVDNDLIVEVILSSTSQDAIQFLDYDNKVGFSKKELSSNPKMTRGIFASCFFSFNQTKKPKFTIGNLSRSYFAKNSSSGVFDYNGRLLFDFNIDGDSEIKNIHVLDLNGDTSWDFVIENNGNPPKSKLEVFISKNDSYEKVDGLNIVNPSGVIYSDFNNDGRIDLLFGRSTKRAPFIEKSGGILINNIQQSGKSLRVFFEGHEKFKNAEGGIFELETTGGIYKSVIQYQQGGLPSQSSRFIQFGLGKHKAKSATLTLGAKKIKYNIAPFSKSNKITLCPEGVVKSGKKKCD